MKNKYLSKNPMDWMLNKENPSIRYAVLKEILEEKKLDTDYQRLFSSAGIKTLLDSSEDGILGDRKNFDIYYRGTMWCFAEAVERGLDIRTETVKKTADYIIEKTEMTSGGFTFNWNPKTEIACRTGDMVKYLIKAGCRNEAVDNGIRWIVKNQRHDGGWLHCPISGIKDSIKLMFLKKPGKGLERENNINVKSCFYATASCLAALLEYSRESGLYSESIFNGAEFFLRQNIYLNRKNQPVKTRKQWNRDFRLLGYPVLSQYDLLYGLLLTAKAGRIDDPRTGQAFNLLMSKQNSDGTWNLENAQTGMLFGNKKLPLGKRDPWVTLNVLRLLKFVDT
jgi:hypothetical protein